ncbi:hypothetical protein, partial [Klebsiella pneumoniae]
SLKPSFERTLFLEQKTWPLIRLLGAVRPRCCSITPLAWTNLLTGQRERLMTVPGNRWTPGEKSSPPSWKVLQQRWKPFV